MALVWSPLHPLLLVLAPLVICASFWATRFGIAYWFERPPSMSWLLMERLRGMLVWVVAIRLMLQRMAFGDADAATPISAAAAALALFVVVDAMMTGIERLTTADLDEDTMGAPFEPTKMERYVCPKARRGRSKEEALASHLSSPRRSSAVGALGKGLSRAASTLAGSQLAASPLTQSRQRAAEFWQRAYAFEDGTPSGERSTHHHNAHGGRGATAHRKRRHRRTEKRAGAGGEGRELERERERAPVAPTLRGHAAGDVSNAAPARRRPHEGTDSDERPSREHRATDGQRRRRRHKQQPKQASGEQGPSGMV